MLKTKIKLWFAFLAIGVLGVGYLFRFDFSEYESDSLLTFHVTWDVYKPTSLLWSVDGDTHPVEPVPGKSSDKWELTLPHNPLKFYYILVVYDKVFQYPKVFHYSCSIVADGIVRAAKYGNQAGQIACKHPTN